MKAKPMLAVWKFKLTPTIDMPENAIVQKVGFDPAAAALVVWALVDPNAKAETRHFAMAKTGEQLPAEIADCRFLDTITAVMATPTGPKFIATHVWEVPAYLATKAKPCTPGDEWKQGQ